MAKTIRLKTPRLKPQFKYSINEQLTMLPRQFKISDVLAHLSKSGITRNEFYRDRAIKFGSSQSIPSDRLKAYSHMFDCADEDLMNYSIKTRSLRDSINPVKTVLK